MHWMKETPLFNRRCGGNHNIMFVGMSFNCKYIYYNTPTKLAYQLQQISR